MTKQELLCLLEPYADNQIIKCVSNVLESEKERLFDLMDVNLDFGSNEIIFTYVEKNF